jgi:Tfp pilus assembly protein PilX
MRADRRPERERGAVLVIVMISALVAAIVAYAELFVSASQAKHARFYRERTDARYLAEAAIVIAREKLFNEAATPFPPGCPPGGTQTVTEHVDVNGNGVSTDLVDRAVEVTVTNCGAGRLHLVTAKVMY